MVVQARAQYMEEMDLLIKQAEQERADILVKLRDDYREYTRQKVGTRSSQQGASRTLEKIAGMPQEMMRLTMDVVARQCYFTDLLVKDAGWKSASRCMHLAVSEVRRPMEGQGWS